MPPRGKMPAIDSTVSGMVRSVQISPSKPSLMPMTRQPCPKIAAAHRAANDGVQPGAVSSPVCNADGLDGLSHRSSVGGRLQGLKRKKVFYTIREMGPRELKPMCHEFGHARESVRRRCQIVFVLLRKRSRNAVSSCSRGHLGGDGFGVAEDPDSLAGGVDGQAKAFS